MIFDVLKSDLDIHKSYFVEASAGCGKTFSIENVVVRLVMDVKNPIEIGKILVLTFTKEATSELKARIRNSLEFAKRSLEDPINSPFDYIQVFAQKPKEEIDRAIFLLNEALICFDLSQIFTIHKFCYNQLKKFLFEANLNLLEDPEKEAPSLKFYEGIVKDYLGFYYQEKSIHPKQLKLLLSYFKNDLSRLIQAIVNQLLKEVPISAPITFLRAALLAKDQLLNLKPYTQEQIFDMYLKAASLFKGAANLKKQVFQFVVESVKAFSEYTQIKDLNIFFEHIEVFTKIFNFENLKKNAEAQKQQHEAFFIFHNKVEKELFPIFRQISQKENLLSLICFECQKIVNKIFLDRKIVTPNNLLLKFKEMVQNAEITKKIQSRYGAVIVDEFQDTDPVQWEILSRIFLKNKKIPIYLVGDPKQSIYGFRRADIYTYLKASKMLGIANISTLQVNYRSQPGLISALNALFSYKKNNWLSLPKLNTFLSYQPVLSFEKIERKNFQDDKGSLHMMICHQKEKNQRVPSTFLEENKLFPFIINEILRVHQSHGWPLRSFAVLVRDRYQGARFKEFLKRFKLSFMSTRPESMQGLPIVRSFLEIYKAVLNPKNESLLLALKLNPLLNLPSSYFENKLPFLIKLFIQFHETLLKKGFLAFFYSLTSEIHLFKVSLYEEILSQKLGLYTYLELEQIKDLLLLKEREGDNPYHLQRHLKDLCDPFALADQTYPLRQNFEEDGVQILTLHMSKGLEFEVVFTLGLMNQGKVYSDLVLDSEENKLMPLSTKKQEDQDLFYEEQNAEKLRQLYVAMTRAKQRLYFPVVFTENKPDSKVMSATELFLERLNLNENSLKCFAETHNEISLSVLDEEVEVDVLQTKKEVKLSKPNPRHRFFKSQVKHSFSSLAKIKETQLVDLRAPHDFLSQIKNVHTLPAGAITGVLVHHIMEKVDFKNPQVEDFLRNTPFWPWKNEIEDLILTLLQTKIEIKNSSFSLEMLSKDSVYKEVEFLYPVENNEKIEEVAREGDYLKGFIDLICRYNGKYYLIDYKTNWLGDKSSDYENLEEAMSCHQYFLQAKIYQKALKKYLNLFESKPFEECFGGTIYWFVRGVHNTNKGLFIF